MKYTPMNSLSHTHTHSCSGARVAAVQAALSRRLDNDEDLPMSSRRANVPPPHAVVSPSTSFSNEENGVVNSIPTSGSRSSTPGGYLQVSHVTVMRY